MDAIAKSKAQDRSNLFKETAARKDIAPGIVEKDFWVCWSLKRLFGLDELKGRLIFKGGTSLSKAYNVIQRFSEDIDVTIDRASLGFSGEKDPANQKTGKARDRMLDQLKDESFRHAHDMILPMLESDISRALGNKKEPESAWGLELQEERDGSPTVIFTYPPAILATGATLPDYIKPSVRIEFGARGDVWPAKDFEIGSYAADAFPEVFSVRTGTVRVLEIERTFWEKATLLHAEFHKPSANPRLSRHYSDIVAIFTSVHGASALARLDLLKSVAEHKAVFFRSSPAKYDEAKPGSLRLVPPEARLKELRQDFEKMKVMYFGDPPKFDWILEQLGGLEKQINK